MEFGTLRSLKGSEVGTQWILVRNDVWYAINVWFAMRLETI